MRYEGWKTRFWIRQWLARSDKYLCQVSEGTPFKRSWVLQILLHSQLWITWVDITLFASGRIMLTSLAWKKKKKLDFHCLTKIVYWLWNADIESWQYLLILLIYQTPFFFFWVYLCRKNNWILGNTFAKQIMTHFCLFVCSCIPVVCYSFWI